MLITPAFAQAAGGGDTNSMLMSLLPFALIFVIMYFLILRPQQKKVKDHQELVKNIRRGDTVGTMVEEYAGEIEELSPLATTLESAGKEGRTVPVHLHSKVTEIGTLELSCISRDGKDKWKLEFNVREQ